MRVCGIFLRPIRGLTDVPLLVQFDSACVYVFELYNFCIMYVLYTHSKAAKTFLASRF